MATTFDDNDGDASVRRRGRMRRGERRLDATKRHTRMASCGAPNLQHTEAGPWPLHTTDVERHLSRHVHKTALVFRQREELDPFANRHLWPLSVVRGGVGRGAREAWEDARDRDDGLPDDAAFHVEPSYRVDRTDL